MRAKVFYRTLGHLRKIYNRERNLFLRDLCNIGVIPHHFQHYKESWETFQERAFPKPAPAALALDDENTARIAAAMFRATGGVH